MKKIIIAYVPVLHEGYRRFFEKYQDAELWILGTDLIGEADYLAKEIRALDPELIKKSIESWGIFDSIDILTKKNIGELKLAKEIIAPREDAIEDIIKKYLLGENVIFDDVFLRWDKHNTLVKKPVTPNQKISEKDFDCQMMQLVYQEAQKSSDWWRRMGAIVVKDGEIIITTRNRHVPSDHTPYVDGDPRNCWHKGMHLELSTVLHAEAGAIAEAARKGISLEDAEIYTGTFPCPPCAKLVAYSGIKKLFYREGYGVLDGEDILKSQGVEIIFVDVDIKEKKTLGDTEYKK